MSDSSQWVVVDNTDPGITYSPADGWTPKIVNISHPEAMNWLVPPLYGTFQEYQFVANANFTFTFTGVDIVAIFSSVDIGAIGSCTLDGRPMNIQLLAPPLRCINNHTVQYGSHVFTVTANRDCHLPLLLDYIFYDPVEGSISLIDVDGMYKSGDPSIEFHVGGDAGILIFSGDLLDFNFVGYSLGIYATFLNGSAIPAPASYSIDGNTPVNFTISNISSDLTPAIAAAIVLQIPRYSLDQHHFHLDFWGNESTTMLELAYIVVQNTTTPPVLLDPFPAILSPNPSTTKPPSILPTVPTVSSTHRGPIIAGTISGAIILVLIVLTFFLYRLRRLQASSLFGKIDNSNHTILVVEPFQQQHSTVRPGSWKHRGNEGHNNVINTETGDVEPNLLIEPFYHWRTHFQSFRKNLVRRRRTEPTPINTRNVEPNPAAPIVVQRPFRFRVHEDSGDQITQPDEGTVIVDLPPTYTTIGFTAPSAPAPNKQLLAMTRDEGEANRDIDIDDPHNTIKVQC